MPSHFCFLNNCLIFSTFNSKKDEVQLSHYFKRQERQESEYVQIVFTPHPPEIPTRVERCSQQGYIYIQSASVDISLKCAVTLRTFASPPLFAWKINEYWGYL